MLRPAGETRKQHTRACPLVLRLQVTKDMENCALKCDLSDFCEIFAWCTDSAG